MSAAVLPPQNVDAERSVLGGILLDPESLDDVVDSLEAEHFYRAEHRHIYAAMRSLAGTGQPIDLITLADELRRSGHLEAAGGPAYLGALDSATPHLANLGQYAKIVRDAAVERRLLRAAHFIAGKVHRREGTTEALLDSAEQEIFDVTEQKATSTWKPMTQTVRAAFTQLETLYERQTDLTGVATGFGAFDRMTAGLQAGDLIIVAGRPSMGKTAWVMNVAAHVAIEQGLPVGVFSLEMGAESLTTRLFSAEARVDGQRLRTGRLLESDWPKLTRAADRLYKAPIHIDDSAGMSALEMRSKARRLKARHGLGLVVVDYLQLMRGRSNTDNREQEISEISRGLKGLAKELQVPVVALSQLNRSLEKREDKRPMMSDLRESGAIEQDADLICFIYRDEVYNKDTETKGVAELIIGKQRNGPTGTVRVAFQRDFTRFEELAEDRQ